MNCQERIINLLTNNKFTTYLKTPNQHKPYFTSLQLLALYEYTLQKPIQDVIAEILDNLTKNKSNQSRLDSSNTGQDVGTLGEDERQKMKALSKIETEFTTLIIYPDFILINFSAECPSEETRKELYYEIPFKNKRGKYEISYGGVVIKKRNFWKLKNFSNCTDEVQKYEIFQQKCKQDIRKYQTELFNPALRIRFL